MTYTQERDEFIGRLARLNVRTEDIRTILRHAGTLQKIAELECSSEAADRDRVTCPGVKDETRCICDQYEGEGKHDTVTRISVQGARVERAVLRICDTYAKISPRFNGDPRGAVLTLEVGDPKQDVYVPAKGFTSAQMERICR